MPKPTPEQTNRAREFWHTRPNVRAMAQLIADVYEEGYRAAAEEALQIVEAHATIWFPEMMMAELRALKEGRTDG